MRKIFILIFFVATLLALVSCQDAANHPDKLLADINPGPNSSYTSGWYTIASAGKAYTSVIIKGKAFWQIAVTDGTTAGTKLLRELNQSNRGNPFATDPFWNPNTEWTNPIQFFDFDGILWVATYNYDTTAWDIWTVDPADDELRKYDGGIIKSVGKILFKEVLFLNIQDVGIFKGEYFVFNSDAVNHGLYFFDKAFSSSYVINNASQFKIVTDPLDDFTGFDASSSTYFITDEFLIIEGQVQNNGGLWAYDGMNVWPLNLDTTSFHEKSIIYDSENKKLYYIAFFNDLPQLVVNDLKDLASNYTILTNLNQNCSPKYECFSYLGMMNDQTGTVAFVYNTQIGFTNGTLSGTTFWIGSPRVGDVLGTYNNMIYFQEYIDSITSGALVVTDGTKLGTKSVLDVHAGEFFYLNGIVLFQASAKSFWRLDRNGKFTQIRSSMPFIHEVFAQIILPNNHKQLYLRSLYSVDCGRSCSRDYSSLWVTDGTGIVQFARSLGPKEPAVVLNNRFIITATSDATGYEPFYMDMATEAYIEPPPVPEPSSGPYSVTSTATRSKQTLLFIFVYCCYYCKLLMRTK